MSTWGNNGNSSSSSLDSAVSFARKMTREGKDFLSAVRIASQHYKVEFADVQKAMASLSGRSQAGKKKALKPERMCENCREWKAVWKISVKLGSRVYLTHYSCEACGPEPPCWSDYGTHELRHATCVATRYIPSPDPNSLTAARRDWNTYRKSIFATIYQRDDNTCAYCKARFDSRDDLTIDHILPLSRGGTSKPENLCTCCRSCNSRKGAKTPEEWKRS